MQLTRIVLYGWLCALLSGCLGLSSAWTGVSLVYDRHGLYKKLSDYQLTADANRALYHDGQFKRDDCAIDVAAFNGDLLIVGHLPTDVLRDEAYTRITRQVHGYRRLFNQIAVGHFDDHTAEDSWITAKIRSQMVADSNIDPHQFKVITMDNVVYLMGDALSEDANRLIDIAKQTDGVLRVVKLFKLYHFNELSDREKPGNNQAF